MRAVLLDVPEHLLAERRRLGQDRFDEMWEGELHMVPPPSFEHQRMEAALSRAMHPACVAAGLEVLVETGLFDPDVAGHTSYRQPDLVVFGPDVTSERGIEGAAEVVVEIASPGDESLDKVEFYSRVGVRELLVIDRDSKAVRRWAAQGEGLVERASGDEGWHRLEAVALAVRGHERRVEIRDGATVTAI